LREPRGWRALYGVTALCLLAHIVGDLITSFGTIILAPFSDWRAAIAAAAVLAGYVGFQYVQKQRATELGLEYARSKGMQQARVTVHPRPVSPFNWTVFVSDDQAHRFAHVNLVRKEPRRYTPGDGFVARLDSPYLPVEQMVWVTRRRYGETDQALIREAWNAADLGFFRWFADLPAFDGRGEGSTCVWFTDLRFLTPGREGMPFRYRVCRDAPGSPWRLSAPY
jgi:inner membrane protein